MRNPTIFEKCDRYSDEENQSVCFCSVFVEGFLCCGCWFLSTKRCTDALFSSLSLFLSLLGDVYSLTSPSLISPGGLSSLPSPHPLLAPHSLRLSPRSPLLLLLSLPSLFLSFSLCPPVSLSFPLSPSLSLSPPLPPHPMAARTLALRRLARLPGATALLSAPAVRGAVAAAPPLLLRRAALPAAWVPRHALSAAATAEMKAASPATAASKTVGRGKRKGGEEESSCPRVPTFSRPSSPRTGRCPGRAGARDCRAEAQD